MCRLTDCLVLAHEYCGAYCGQEEEVLDARGRNALNQLAG